MTAAEGKKPAAPLNETKNLKAGGNVVEAAPVKKKVETTAPAAKSGAPKTTTVKSTAPEKPATVNSTVTKAQADAKSVAATVAVTPVKSGEKTSPAKPAEPVGVAPAPSAVKETVDARPASISAAKPAAAAVAKPRPVASKLGFKLNEHIVYPAHGVGQIVSVEIQEVAGFSLELYVVSFIKDKMILKVPTSKVSSVGMRKLAETNIVEKALSTLSGRARIKRTMWSRRAQEYEAKINSGDLVTIAEVVRDLYRSDTQPEQSYSERQLYEAALDRMAREISAVRRLIDAEALKLIESFLQKGPKRGLKSDVEGDGDGAVDLDESDADVDAAA